MAAQYEEPGIDCALGTLPGSSTTQQGCINDMMVCPYDESHVMAGGKYHIHVTECRVKEREKGNALVSLLKVCPYNTSHHVHYKVYGEHVEVCPGYYMYRMNLQEQPRSMQKTVKPAAKTRGNKFDADDVSEWWGEDDDTPISGQTLTDIQGRAITPLTRGEFMKAQRQISHQLALGIISDGGLGNELQKLNLSGEHTPAPGYEFMKTNTNEELAMCALKQYKKEAEIMKKASENMM